MIDFYLVIMSTAVIVYGMSRYWEYRRSKNIKDAVEMIMSNPTLRTRLLYELRRMIHEELDRLCRRDSLLEKIKRRR